MYLSNRSLLVIIVVGIVAGWLAGKVVQGTGFGLVWDLIVGLIEAFIGDWLLPRLGIHLGAGIVALIVNAFIGAVVLLLILQLVSGWRGGPSGATVVNRASRPPSSVATVGFKKRDDFRALLRGGEAAIGLHVVARNYLVGITDEAVESRPVPHQIRAFHRT